MKEDSTDATVLRELLLKRFQAVRDTKIELIVEGQKRGEIVRDAPDKLALMIFQCIQGLSTLALENPEKNTTSITRTPRSSCAWSSLDDEFASKWLRGHAATSVSRGSATLRFQLINGNERLRDGLDLSFGQISVIIHEKVHPVHSKPEKSAPGRIVLSIHSFSGRSIRQFNLPNKLTLRVIPGVLALHKLPVHPGGAGERLDRGMGGCPSREGRKATRPGWDCG